MKTQISRDNFRPRQRYSGVYQQQGRMFTDYDFNELVELVKARLVNALADAIGSGTPPVLVEAPGKLPKRHGPQLQAIGNIVRIFPGWLYADGVPARIPGELDQGYLFDEQTDFRNPPPLPADCHLYVDVWDRTVTSLEDEDLLDPGLHGADTCSRTRTMAQVKHCPSTIDPDYWESHPPFPKIGTALLTFRLRQGVVLADPCDPCADTIDLASRVGNYLFRLEVHDVVGPADSPERIQLKWSRENGAEYHKVADAPDDFKAGPWIYEFFDYDCETQLGVHMVPQATWQPQRGELTPAWPNTPNPDLLHVRRWDGTCVLHKDSSGAWQLAVDDGVTLCRDMGVVLSASVAADSHGHAEVTTNPHPVSPVMETLIFQANLERVDVVLSIQDQVSGAAPGDPGLPHHFLAGDYWLVPVRETEDQAGDTLVTRAPPDGIEHHYLHMITLDDGNQVPWTDAQRRRHEFPSLTDMRAIDIGFTDNCPKLFEGAENVQAALDNLCQISADDIAFTDNCPKLFEGAENLQMALDNLCQINASAIAFSDNCPKLFDGAENLQMALDNLCQISAGAIAFSSTCEVVKDSTNVEEALNALCERSKGCRLTVGKGGHFPDLKTALVALMDPNRKPPVTDICLCVLPGEHNIDDLRVGRPVVLNPFPDPGPVPTPVTGTRPAPGPGATPAPTPVTGTRVAPTGPAATRPETTIAGTTGLTTTELVEDPIARPLASPGQRALNVSLVGCGPGVVVRVSGTLSFIDMDSLHLEGLHFICGPKGRISISYCGDVRIHACQFEGSGTHSLLSLAASGPSHIALSQFRPDARANLSVPIKVINHDLFTNFFNDRSDTPLPTRANEAAAEIVKIGLVERRTLAGAIGERLKALPVYERENIAYTNLMNTLNLSGVSPSPRAATTPVITAQAVSANLVDLVNATLVSRPGSAMILVGNDQDVTVVDNQILGSVDLGGLHANELPLNRGELETLATLIRQIDKIDFQKAAGRLSLRGNRIQRIALGDNVLKFMRFIKENPGTILIDYFKTAFITDNVFDSDQNQILARNNHLNSNSFPFLNDGFSIPVAVIGETALYLGNHCDFLGDVAPAINATRSGSTNTRAEINEMYIQDA